MPYAEIIGGDVSIDSIDRIVIESMNKLIESINKLIESINKSIDRSMNKLNKSIESININKCVLLLILSGSFETNGLHSF